MAVFHVRRLSSFLAWQVLLLHRRRDRTRVAGRDGCQTSALLQSGIFWGHVAETAGRSAPRFGIWRFSRGVSLGVVLGFLPRFFGVRRTDSGGAYTRSPRSRSIPLILLFLRLRLGESSVRRHARHDPGDHLHA